MLLKVKGKLARATVMENQIQPPQRTRPFNSIIIRPSRTWVLVKELESVHEFKKWIMTEIIDPENENEEVNRMAEKQDEILALLREILRKLKTANEHLEMIQSYTGTIS